MPRLLSNMFIVWLLVMIICIFMAVIVNQTEGWEEITVWDHGNWSSSSEISVIPYSKWDSQEGSSYGYVYDYQPYYNWIPPAERELERQEVERREWWRDEYKEWLKDQGVDKGVMIGW